MIKFKAIKAARPFQSSIFRTEVTQGANEVKRDMLNDFKATTKTWDEKPTFGFKVDSGADVGGVRIQIGTDDPVYAYVDEGTKRHKIPKRPLPPGKSLAFPGGKYRPKTKPHFIGSVPGGPTGKTVFRKQVTHPGIKARGFTKDIAKKWDKKFRDLMQAALDRFAERSGHRV